jgi:hypothetical protein
MAPAKTTPITINGAFIPFFFFDGRTNNSGVAVNEMSTSDCVFGEKGT